MSHKFETLQEALDKLFTPPKTRARGMTALLKEHKEAGERYQELSKLLKETCTHAKLFVKKEYMSDDWARLSWNEYHVKCEDCGKYFGEVIQENRVFAIKEEK
jgi:hypothetical protein